MNWYVRQWLTSIRHWWFLQSQNWIRILIYWTDFWSWWKAKKFRWFYASIKKILQIDPQIKELEEIYETCGYPMVFVSAKEERGIEKIRELLKGKTTAIAGRKIFDHQYSAAGRRDETGAISTKIERGKHTTRHSELFAIDEDSYIMGYTGI